MLVDWKSGSRPKIATMQSRRFQLGLYRIAFSRIMGVDPERISTVFVYLGGQGVAGGVGSPDSRRPAHRGAAGEGDPRGAQRLGSKARQQG